MTLQKPSFVLGYWRPWKDNSNFIDSYLDYRKDVSLAKYGADGAVGKRNCLRKLTRETVISN